jgi:hypothetical protein
MNYLYKLSIFFVASLFLLANVSVVFGATDLSGCAGYPDVHFSSDFCSAITYVQRKEILTGQGSGEYLPDAILTRAEAAAVLVRYLDLSLPSSYPLLDRFPDVDLSQWYAPYFEVLLQRNIFEGYPDGTLRPGGSLAKSEWLKLWYATQGIQGSLVINPTVVDVPNASGHDWYRFYLYDAIENNYIDVPTGYFFPADGQKRKFVADLIYKFDQMSRPNVIDSNPVSTNPVDVLVSSDDYFGNNLFAFTQDQESLLAKELGIGTYYSNDYIGVFSSSPTNPSVVVDNLTDLADEGYQPVVRLYYDEDTVDEDQLSDFANWVEVIVDEVSETVLWQIDNDTLDAEEYVVLLKAFSEALPVDAQLVQGAQRGMSSTQQSFWQDVYDAGGVEYISIVLVELDGVGQAQTYAEFIDLSSKGLPLGLIVDLKDMSVSNTRVFWNEMLELVSVNPELIIFNSLTDLNGQYGKLLSFFSLELLVDTLVDVSGVTDISGDYLRVEANDQYFFRYDSSYDWKSFDKDNYVGVDLYGNEVRELLDADLIWK